MKKYYSNGSLNLNNEASFDMEVTDGVVTGVRITPTSGDAATEADNRQKQELLGTEFVPGQYDEDVSDCEGIEAHYKQNKDFARK